MRDSSDWGASQKGADMSRWGKVAIVSILAVAVGACTAAPRKVATTTPVTSSSPAPTPIINVQPTVVPASATRSISALGTGTITVRPDTLIGSLSVSITRGTLSTAMSRLTALVGSVSRIVVANGGRATDVSTTGSNLYVYQNGSRTNYQVSQNVLVRVPNNDAAMRLLAKIASALGTNLQGGINTTLVSSDEDPFYAQARKAAIADAKEAAAAWASLEGVSLGRLLSVSEIAPSASNSPTSYLGGGYGYQTPTDVSVTINKGAFTYSVRIAAVYEIK